VYKKYENIQIVTTMMTMTTTATATNYPSLLVLRGKEMVKNQILNHHQPKKEG
jgi:hypothetical protein